MSPLGRPEIDLISNPNDGRRIPQIVTPAVAGWRYLSFWTHALKAGADLLTNTHDCEVALVPLRGKGSVTTEAGTHRLDRVGVFRELPHVLYLPPGTRYNLAADEDFELAVGSAPAEGRYPERLITPDEINVEMRGGANVQRQVSHLLAPPLQAERLVLFEVYTPSGNWSSWPPHCHDGNHGSPVMEEIYYYRIHPKDGFALQRLYTGDGRDELLMPRHGDAVIVPEGHHPVAAAPGSNVYYLNVLAGPERSTNVADDPTFAWMRQDWGGRAMKLPIGS